jgi:hypothetical protein
LASAKAEAPWINLRREVLAAESLGSKKSWRLNLYLLLQRMLTYYSDSNSVMAGGRAKID